MIKQKEVLPSSVDEQAHKHSAVETNERMNEGTKERMNEGTKARRNEGTKERRNE